MQVSELEALDPGQRIRVTIDDTRHQMWVRTPEGFTNGTLNAEVHTFIAPLAADRVVVVNNNDLTYADLPKYRFIPEWANAPGRSAWVQAMWGEVMAGVPADLRTNDRYSEERVCLIKTERHPSFAEVTADAARVNGIPRGLIGLYFRFMTSVERLSDHEAAIQSLPLLRISRSQTRNYWADVDHWFNNQDIVEMRCAPVRNAGAYHHLMVAPEGITTGGFTIEAYHCAEYHIPEVLIGMNGQWVRDPQIAPSEEEVAALAAARANQAEWFNEQPKYRVATGRFGSRFDRDAPLVMHLTEMGTAQNDHWIGMPLPENGETYGMWEVTEQRQREFHLPMETVGMIGYWMNARFLTLVDPVTEWLDSLPKRRYLETGDDPPAGDYMETRPPVAYVETGRTGGTGGLFFARLEDSVDWGFWDDSDMYPFIPEHLHEHMGTSLMGYWVDPLSTERVLTPEEQEAEVLARITDAVQEAEERMQRTINTVQATLDRTTRHLVRVSESLQSMLNEHDYDYGCDQDDVLEEAGYPRERPTEEIWVEVKVTGEGYYTVDDSDIESSFDHNITTESGSYDVRFDWEREERVEYVSVEQGTCVCGDDADDVLNLEDLRQRLRGMNLPGSGRDWEFEIVNCENG